MPKPPEPPEPPIHAAARIGDIAALDRLVRGGADVNLKTDLEVDNGSHLRDLTPLMVAARSIDGATAETLRWLLDHGADLHARSEGGETAAYYAAGKGGRWDFHPWRLVPDHVDRLQLLLDAGLNANETNFVGLSLLTEACAAGDASRVRLLLARGALLGGPPVIPRKVDSFFDLVRSHGTDVSEEVLESMRNSLPQRDLSCREGFAIPLFVAATSGSADSVRVILEAGADPSERDSDGRTALMYAGSASAADTLIDAGLDPNERTTDGDDVIFVLLRGAACDSGLCGPGRFNVVRAVIARGGRLDRPGSKFNNTRLYDAAFGHDAEGVLFFLSQGCRADEVDDHGRTTLHAICWQGEYSSPHTNARCEQIIRTLVAAGADVNAADISGNTPLHEAADGDWGNQTAVRTLLELGAHPDPVACDGRTPLMHAAARGDVETVKLLLAAGADRKRETSDGRTAVTEAIAHLRSWRHIIQHPPEVLPLLGTADEQRERHQEALRKAEQCAALLGVPPTIA